MNLLWSAIIKNVEIDLALKVTNISELAASCGQLPCPLGQDT
jgi:hypothetical protein